MDRLEIIENGWMILYTNCTRNVSSDIYTTHLMLGLRIDTMNTIRHSYESIGNEKEDVFYASLMQPLDEFFPCVRRLCWCNGKVYNFFVSFFRHTNSYIYSFFFNRLTSNWNMSGIQVNAHIAFF